MLSWKRASLLFIGVILFSAGVAEAGLFRCLFHHGRYCGHAHCRPRRCCQVCLQPQPLCTCTTLKPVVETRYRQQNIVTYRDVTETRYRQETCVSKVPVTTYQDRVTHRTVPYTVTRRVPQVSTRMIPYQTVRYVPQQTPVNLGCSTCGSSTSTVPPFTTVQTASPLRVNNPIPAPGPITSSPGLQTKSAVVPNPTPDANFRNSRSANPYDASTSVEPNQSQSDRLGGYLYGPTSSRRSSGLFRPAPSAATVWHSRVKYHTTSVRR